MIFLQQFCDNFRDKLLLRERESIESMKNSSFKVVHNNCINIIFMEELHTITKNWYFWMISTKK